MLQKGSALVIVLILLTSIMLLLGSLFYFLTLNTLQNRAVMRYNNVRNAAFFAMRQLLRINDLKPYNPPRLKKIQRFVFAHQDHIHGELVSVFNRLIFTNNNINSLTALWQYRINIKTQYHNISPLNYHAIVNIMPEFRLNNTIQENDKQNINIPPRNLDQLTERQKININSDKQDVGFVGILSFDRSEHALIFRHRTTNTTFVLSLPRVR